MTDEITPQGVMRATARFVLRNRAMVRALAISLLIDVALTVGVAWNTVHLHTLSVEAQRESCIANNHFRAQDKQLWEHVLTVTVPAHPTPAQAAVVHDLWMYLDRTMALRNCGSQ